MKQHMVTSFGSLFPKVGDLVKTVSRGEWWWSQKLGIVVKASDAWVRVQVIGAPAFVMETHGTTMVKLRWDEVMVISEGASSS
jgi:hypothetical protein